MTTYISNYQVC